MAARKNRGVGPGSMSRGWKDKITAGVVADRIWKCATGELAMSAVQLKAATAIFDRLDPTLARSEVDNKHSGAITITWLE